MKRFLQIILLTISVNALGAEVIIPFGKNNLSGQLLKYKFEGTIQDASEEGSRVTEARYSTHYFMNTFFNVDPTFFTGNFYLYIKAGYVSHTIQLSMGTWFFLPANSKVQMITKNIS